MFTDGQIDIMTPASEEERSFRGQWECTLVTHGQCSLTFNKVTYINTHNSLFFSQAILTVL